MADPNQGPMEIWRQLWVVFRLALIVLASLYALLFLMNNSGHSTSIWYWPFKSPEEMSVLALAIVSFFSGLVLGVAGYATISGITQYRRAREMRQLKHVAELNRKAAMLRVRPIVTRRPAPAAAVVAPATPIASIESTEPVEGNELQIINPAPEPTDRTEDASTDAPIDTTIIDDPRDEPPARKA